MAVAAAYLTYPGAVDESAIGEIKGPDTVGGACTVVSIQPLPDGRTRVGFAYGMRCGGCFELITPERPGHVLGTAYGARATHAGCVVS